MPDQQTNKTLQKMVNFSSSSLGQIPVKYAPFEIFKVF